MLSPFGFAKDPKKPTMISKKPDVVPTEKIGARAAGNRLRKSDQLKIKRMYKCKEGVKPEPEPEPVTTRKPKPQPGWRWE